MRKHLIVLMLGLGLLSACGKEPPAAAPGASPTPAVTPSSTPTAAPVLPEEAKANTKAGAIAFVRHYVELINYAQATGDTKALAQVESRTCESCTNGRKYLYDLYSRGGHVEGGAFHPTSVQAIGKAEDADWLVLTTLKIDPEIVKRPWQSPPAKHHKGGLELASYFVTYSGDRWSISKWTRG